MKLLLWLLFYLSAADGQPRSIAPAEPATGNLPIQRIGVADLLAVSVYDAPELSRSVRVNPDGNIKLPMLKAPLKVKGYLPVQIEAVIGDALQKEEIMIRPLVTVTVTEYHSRPIHVIGAVKNPLTFQAVGPTSLLEAIGRAGGLAENAGSEILVTRIASEPAAPFTCRIRIKDLIDGADESLNIALFGGEEIRVPAAGRVFIMGNVKKPGAYMLREPGEGSVLQMLALAEGLAPYPTKLAYIYRPGSDGLRTEVPVELEAIMKRRHEDVSVLPGDILYIPDNKGRRLSAMALERVLAFGSTAGATALIYGGR